MLTVELSLQTRAAAIVPATVQEEDRSVEVVWSTGAVVRRADWVSGKVYEEELSLAPDHVRLDRLNSGAPVLNSHDRFDLRGVIGVVERAWLADNAGRARIRFSRRHEVEPIWQDVLDGVLRAVSIGYKVYRYQERPGHRPPRLVAVDWEPEEISLVAVGADAQATVRADDAGSPCDIELAQAFSPGPAGRPVGWARMRLALAERESR